MNRLMCLFWGVMVQHHQDPWKRHNYASSSSTGESSSEGEEIESPSNRTNRFTRSWANDNPRLAPVDEMAPGAEMGRSPPLRRSRARRSSSLIQTRKTSLSVDGSPVCTLHIHTGHTIQRYVPYIVCDSIHDPACTMYAYSQGNRVHMCDEKV
jgi:hypothetical protein